MQKKSNLIQHASNPFVELYHSSSAQEWDFKTLLPPYPVQKRLVTQCSSVCLQFESSGFKIRSSSLDSSGQQKS